MNHTPSEQVSDSSNGLPTDLTTEPSDEVASERAGDLPIEQPCDWYSDSTSDLPNYLLSDMPSGPPVNLASVNLKAVRGWARGMVR